MLIFSFDGSFDMFKCFVQMASSTTVKASAANKVALHIARSIGTLYIGEAIVSLQAPGFLHVRDKKALLLSRTIVREPFLSRSIYMILNELLIVEII